MPAVKLDTRIKLLSYKAKIDHIKACEAYPPLYSKDLLMVFAKFIGSHPRAFRSIAIGITAKKYSRGQLLKVIKKEGNKQLTQALNRARLPEQLNAHQRQRRQELDALVKRAEEVLR